MGTVFDLLDAEWARLRARRPRHLCALVSDATTLGELEAYVRRASPEAADLVLLALVRRAVAGDDLAARVLLQLLLPGTRNLARRWWALGDPDERAAAAVTAVYDRIRHYPVERRPGRVAANVLMDAARELRRSVAQTEHTVPTSTPEVPDVPAAPHPAAELADVLLDAVAAGTLTRDDAELIARSRIAGTRIETIARQRRTSTRTLWARRHTAEHHLTTTHAATHATAS